MKERNIKRIVWVVGVILLLVVGYVAAGPYLTVSAIKTGIVEQDSEKLSENIEFPTLRQNLKDQLNAAMMKNAARELKDNPFAALAAGLATKMVYGIVNSFVTLRGLAALMGGKKPSKNRGTESTITPKKENLFKDAKIHLRLNEQVLYLNAK